MGDFRIRPPYNEGGTHQFSAVFSYCSLNSSLYLLSNSLSLFLKTGSHTPCALLVIIPPPPGVTDLMYRVCMSNRTLSSRRVAHKQRRAEGVRPGRGSVEERCPNSCLSEVSNEPAMGICMIIIHRAVHSQSSAQSRPPRQSYIQHGKPISVFSRVRCTRALCR